MILEEHVPGTASFPLTILLLVRMVFQEEGFEEALVQSLPVPEQS